MLVLVDSAERPEEIDANRAQRAAAEAKEAMLQKKTVQEYKMAQAHLARAINRLRVKRSFARNPDFNERQLGICPQLCGRCRLIFTEKILDFQQSGGYKLNIIHKAETQQQLLRGPAPPDV